MSRHVMTLLQFVESEIDGERWASYQKCARIGPEALWRTTGFEKPFRALDEIPYDDPSAKLLFDMRRSLERRFIQLIKEAEAEGRITVQGFDKESGRFEVIDTRSVLMPSVRFLDNEVGTTHHHYTAIEVTIVDRPNRRSSQVNRRSTDEVRAELEGAVAEWLAKLEANENAPNTEKWFFARAQERFRNPHLTEYLFRRVWRALPFPHPLKIGGRPPRR